jgi:hypothetical protein
VTLSHVGWVALPYMPAVVQVEYWHTLLDGLYNVCVYRTSTDKAALIVSTHAGKKIAGRGGVRYNYMLPLGACPRDVDYWQRVAITLLEEWRGRTKPGITPAWPALSPADIWQ